MVVLETAHRRLELMRILCRRRYETMSNLAYELNVSVKTIQRDIDGISNIIPIYTKTGRYKGGVYVVDGYYIDRMYMSDSEIALLINFKEAALNNQKIMLNEGEMQLLNQIIVNYTKPSLK